MRGCTYDGGNGSTDGWPPALRAADAMVQPWCSVGDGRDRAGPGILAVAALSIAMPRFNPPDGGQSFLSLGTFEGVAFAASIQIVSLILVWVFAGLGGQRAAVLRMTGEKFTAGLYAAAALLLIGATGILELILYKSFDVDIFTDTAWLREGLYSPAALGTFVIAVVLAPLWKN